MERIRITVQFNPRNPDRTSERTCGTIRLKRVLKSLLAPLGLGNSRLGTEANGSVLTE